MVRGWCRQGTSGTLLLARLLPALALTACALAAPPPVVASPGLAPAAARAAPPPPSPKPKPRRAARCVAPRQICDAARFVAKRVRYASDRSVWGVEQHWATPAQVYARGAGDCEDLALLVRLELVSRGVDSSRIALRYGYLEGSVFHVWLTVIDERGRRWIVSNAQVTANRPPRLLAEVTPGTAGRS